MSWKEPTITERCKATGIDLAHFIGERRDCPTCDRPFRTFKADQVECSACGSKPKCQ